MTLSTRFSPHRTHKRDGYPSLSVTPKSWMSSMVAGALISQMPPKGGLSLMWALPVKITPRTRGMHMPKESRASRKISELGHALCSAASQDRILTLTDPRRGTTRTGGSPAKNAMRVSRLMKDPNVPAGRGTSPSTRTVQTTTYAMKKTPRPQRYWKMTILSLLG